MFIVCYSYSVTGSSPTQHPALKFETEEIARAEAEIQANRNNGIYWWVHEVRPGFIMIPKATPKPKLEKVYAAVYN